MNPHDGLLVQLLRAPRSRATMEGGWQAARLGRNNVWRLASLDGRTLYAKHWDRKDVFQRELAGLKLSAEMALGDPRFVYAPIIAAYPESGFIVTGPIPGASLASVVRGAFRKDKNPLRSHKKMAAARGAIMRVVAWLVEFHKQPAPDDDVLYSHSVQDMGARINRKLGQSHQGQSYGQRLGIDEIPLARPDDGSSSSLIMGDVSFSNFYLDGDRVGAIDFEDMGVGASERDFTILRYWLTRTLSGWAYYWDEDLFAQLPDRSASHAGRAAEIERLLLDYEQAILAAANRTERSIHRELCRALASAHCSTSR